MRETCFNREGVLGYPEEMKQLPYCNWRREQRKDGPTKVPYRPGTAQKACVDDTLSDQEEAAQLDPSCTTLEDFYQRTDDIDVRGRIRKYDKRLVRRFIERVEVKPESLVICFKAGVSVEVAG